MLLRALHFLGGLLALLLLNLDSRLDGGAAGAAPRHHLNTARPVGGDLCRVATHHILHVSSLNPVLLPGVLPQQEYWQTGQKAAEDVVDEAALAEAAGVGADEAGPAEQSAQAEADVSATVAQALVPAIRHFGFGFGFLTKLELSLAD